MTIALIDYYVLRDQSEDPVFVVIIETDRGNLETMFEAVFAGKSLELKGLHIGGDPAVNWGWVDLRTLARLILERLNVDEIVVTGGIRTTGRNPGRGAKQWRIRRAGAPEG